MPAERLPMYMAPDMGPLQMHLLNTMPSEEEEKTDTDKALLLMADLLKTLVSGLQEHFPAIDTAIEEIKADGGGGGGGGGGKKNPYGLIQGDVQAQNVSQKVEEQEARLHEMTVQYMHLTGRTDTTESKIKALEVLADDTAVKVKKLVSDVKQLQMEAPILGDRVSMLHQQHKEFSEKIEPKFAPLENDVSVLNGVLQLDKQNFVGKLSASLNLTSPLFTVIDNRLDTLDSDAGDLQKKVRDWCGGCDHLFERLARSRMAHTVGLNFVASTRSKASKGVSFGEDEEEQDEGDVIGWKLGFEGPLSESGRVLLFFQTGGNDLGKCLCFFQSVLNQMSTMEEMIKQWEVFHQSIETRIDERVIRHVDDKLTFALQDPSQRDHAVNLVHALSPTAEYHNLLTRLDMKVDKVHFQTFTAKLYEQVEGGIWLIELASYRLSKLSSLQGHVLGDVRNAVYADEKQSGSFGFPKASNGDRGGHNYGHINKSDITKLRPHRSIQTNTTSSETFKQAHLRLPKPPVAMSPSRASSSILSSHSPHWSSSIPMPRSARNMRPQSAST